LDAGLSKNETELNKGYYQLPHGRVAAIDGDCDFPPLDQALKEPNGLIAIGGDLAPARLLNAYKQGIFPWFNPDEPVMWWSPNPRMVLFPEELKISTSLKKTLKRQSYVVKLNSAFREVITACSQTPRYGQGGTWITDEMIDAYCELHRLGFAMSAETWRNNKLIGGCYGIKIGRMFYGESMFHHATDASKIAFVHLVNYLKNQQVGMIDCQMKTLLLSRFGGREIAREEFMQNLTKLVEF
jgi:leucyl/phenylalanyl-tRNA---protein transferase